MALSIKPISFSDLGLFAQKSKALDPNIHSCGTVRPHGEQELHQSEKDFYIIGVKSYGCTPTFLIATGYEQVRFVVVHFCGDRCREARRVERAGNRRLFKPAGSGSPASAKEKHRSTFPAGRCFLYSANKITG